MRKELASPAKKAATAEKKCADEVQAVLDKHGFTIETFVRFVPKE